MNTISKEMKNRDGSVDTVIISSNDDYKINLSKKYVLVGYAGNKYVDSFKKSVFGSDIGIHSHGFINILVISTLLAIAMLGLMYFTFRI